MTEPSSLEGRTAIVTGAGQGMGRAVAEALSALGARLAVNDLNAQAADQTAEMLRSAGAAGKVRIMRTLRVLASRLVRRIRAT